MEFELRAAACTNDKDFPWSGWYVWYGETGKVKVGR